MTKPAVLVATLGLFQLTGCLQPASTPDPVAPDTRPAPTMPSGQPACIDPGDCDNPSTATPSTPAPTTPSPAASNCGSGEVPVYTYVTGSSSQLGSSGVSQGPGGAAMMESCQAATCNSGQVGVIVPASYFAQRDGSGAMDTASTVTCVDAPPSCPQGQYLAYIPPNESPFASGLDLPGGAGKDPTQTGDTTATGTWHCTGGCALIVQYGPIFGGRAVCAPPVPTCSGGMNPDFDSVTETWICKATCDPGYDLDMYQTQPVCVPC